VSSSGLPELPSVFTPIVALREGGDAMARAIELAPRHGAGTLVWVRAYARVEAAVVLEPEESLAAARPALFAAANAACDALAVLGPPEIPVTLRWPATVAVDGGRVGRVRLAWPPGTAEDQVPEWLVAAVELRIDFPEGWEGGYSPGETSLRQEGFVDFDGPELTAAWARHLMASIAEWQRPGPHGGFRRLAERTLARLEPVPGTEGATRRGLDPATGDLVLEHEGGERRRRALREALLEGAEA
jgi:biotin-(acetyl-CoA carboxylase) ligase